MATPPPAWLEAPPESLGRSPVNTRLQALPFEELDWPNFERLILRVVRSDRTVTDCQIYGTPGQAQHGIDLLAVLASAPADSGCFQCKRVENFGAADVKKAVTKFEEGPWAQRALEFTLCVASSLENTQVVEAIVEERARLADRSIRFAVWDGSQSGALNVRLKALPEIVDDFFGREWVRIFNGEEAADRLGERLDGIDFNALRARLAELYATIFAQHDPGLRVQVSEPIDYLGRYVPADILEDTMLEGIGQGVRQQQSAAALSLEPSNLENKPPSGPRPIALALEAVSARRSAWEWLREQHSCVILGEPGYGKSAMLRQLALTLALANFSESAPIGSEHLRRLPVWLSFARLAAAIAEDSNTSSEDFFCRWLHQYGYADVQPLFRRALRTSELVLLVDGLDEGTDVASGREALDRIITFARSHRAMIVCTSRPRSFSVLTVPTTWSTATLAPFDDEQIKQLATRWFAVLEVSTSGEPVEARRTRAQPRGEAFFDAVRVNPRTHELARNPLLCQALIEMFRLSHRLPEARVRAYAEIIELFLRRHPQARQHAGFASRPSTLEGIRDSDLNDMLVQIAMDTQIAGSVGITSRASCEEACEHYLEDAVRGMGLTHPDASRRAPEIVDALIGYFGILIERAPGDVSFVHLSLQEFLAAEGMTSRPENEQLDWLRQIALQPRWRECLISWFGIQSDTGRKPLAACAVQAIAELARGGEWERLQSLSLRTELACTDVGLPVGEARGIVAEATREVESSPFPALRISLASHIVAGALGGAVKAECGAAVACWVPSRSRYQRARLLHGFRTWAPASDLHATLRQGLLDEALECRRASAETLVDVFPEDASQESHLVSVARSQVRPEVRAAALHGLAHRPESLAVAGAAADWNSGSHSPELVLTCAAVRVQMKRQTSEDLSNLRELWRDDGLEYGLRDELTEVISRGWPRDPELRADSLAILEQDSGTADFPFPLEYLLRSYPSDDEVARILAHLFGRYGLHVAFDPRRFWKYLYEGYRRQPTVVAALRGALTEFKKKYAAIVWHPNNMPAYLVVADDAARDELIEAYTNTDDLQGRYWIADTLIRGWSGDAVVLDVLQGWAAASPALAGPLAAFAERLRPVAAERHRWLEDLVRGADDRIVAHAIEALLTDRPDESTRVLIAAQLARPRLWYYNRVAFEAKLAAHYPNHSESRITVQRALAQIDGPPFSLFAGGYENDASVRKQLLVAATPAPVDVRLAVDSVLRDRSGDPALIDQLTPAMLAEETGAVRSAALLARARAYRRHATEAGVLAEVLAEEAVSIGSYMDLRRRAAFAALLELGQFSRVVAIIAEEKSDWSLRWTDPLEPDPVSLRTLVEHWSKLQSVGAASDVDIQLPIEQLIDDGYGALLERTPALRGAIDQALMSMSQGWRHGYHLELLARRFPRSTVLRERLIRELRAPFPGDSHLRRKACIAARLLSDHFGGEQDVLSALLGTERPEETVRASESGVLGHLVRGWPTSPMALAVRAVVARDRAKWPIRDRLLCAITWNLSTEAEQAAREIVAQRYPFGRFSPEDGESLRLWAKTAAARPVLARWCESTEGDQAITGLALSTEHLGLSALDAKAIRATFNRVFADREPMLLDGINSLTGRNVPWAMGAYTLLSNMG